MHTSISESSVLAAMPQTLKGADRSIARNNEGCGWYGLAREHTVALRLVTGVKSI